MKQHKKSPLVYLTNFGAAVTHPGAVTMLVQWSDGTTHQMRYGAGEARSFARALNELADQVDPHRKEWVPTPVVTRTEPCS